MNARLTNRGMTLVEVLAVVVILGLIAGTLLIRLGGSVGRARHELARSGIGIIVSKLELFYIEHSRWPGNDLGLSALSDQHALPGDPFYLAPDQLIDPWGNRYMFLAPGPDGHPYEIISYGGDGQPGGDGENADISSTSLRGAS